ARIDQLEVAGAIERHEVCLVTLRGGCTHVGLAEFERNDVVAPAVQEKLRYAERQELERRSGTIALRPLGGGPAHQLVDQTVAEQRCAPQVGNPGKRDGGAEAQRVATRRERAGGDPPASGEPDGEMGTGRMPEARDLAAIDRIPSC